MKLYVVVEGINKYTYTYFNHKEDAVKLFDELKCKYEKESSEKNFPITNWDRYFFTMNYTDTDYELSVYMEEKEMSDVASVYTFMDYYLNNPEDIDETELNIWINNFCDAEYDYSMEDCCRCYNEDTHSKLPLNVFEAYVYMWIRLKRH